MSNGHTHIDSHPCAAVIDAGTLARVIAIQIHLGLGIKGIAVFCRQRYACDIEVACYCPGLRNVFPNRSDGAVDTGVGAREREVTSRFIPFLQFGDIQFHAVDGKIDIFLRCQLPKPNEVSTDLCLRAAEIGPKGKAEGIYAFLKLEVTQLHADRNLVTQGGIGQTMPGVVSHALAVLEDSQTVAEVNLAGVAVIHFLQLLIAEGADIDRLCEGAVAAKRNIAGNGGGALCGKRRAIANGQLHVLQRVLGQCCDRDGLIVVVYQRLKVCGVAGAGVYGIANVDFSR